MGLVDTFSAEDRIQVKYSDYYRLVRAEAEKQLIKNGIHAGIPREQILKMLSGQNDELEEYRKTGLTPEQIREMDRLYAEKCKDVAVTTAERDTLEKQLEDLFKQREEEEAAAKKAEADEATLIGTEVSEAPEADKKKKRSVKKTIDKGKIIALKKAGWKVKDIAEDMGLEASAVSQVLWRENQKAKQMGNDENAVL